MKDKIVINPEKLNEFSEEISSLEKKITFVHAGAANQIIREFKENIDLYKERGI